MKTLREKLAKRVSRAELLLPAGRHRQPDPELRAAGADRHPGRRLRRQAELCRSPARSRRESQQIPGAVDVHLHQVTNAPELRVNVDRTRAQELGLTQRDVANSLLDLAQLERPGDAELLGRSEERHQLSGRGPDPAASGRFASTRITSTSLAGERSGASAAAEQLAPLERDETPAVVNHYNVQPVFDVYANVQGRDLGGVADQITKIVNEFRPKLPPGQHDRRARPGRKHEHRVQRLGLGLIFAAVLVYFLMVVNFQIWLDPFIIITALPGAFAGIVWMLFLTHTTFNVPVADGRDHEHRRGDREQHPHGHVRERTMREGRTALDAALAAGHTRLRPVLMTALAMIIGMLPMALGLGEGGEQNAPLGRAVIGGLLLATVATLFFVPVVYSVIRHKTRPREIDDPDLVSTQLEPVTQH